MALPALVAAFTVYAYTPTAGLVNSPLHRRSTTCAAAIDAAAAALPLVQSRSRTPYLALFGLFGGDDPGKETRVPPGFAAARHILLDGAVAGGPEIADALKARLDAGELTFEAAAEQYSVCPSKGKGGDLGVFSSLHSVSFLPYEKGAPADVAAFDAVGGLLLSHAALQCHSLSLSL